MVAALRQLQVAFLAVVWNAFGNAAHSSLHHAEIDHAGVEGLTLRPSIQSKLAGGNFNSTEAWCDLPAMVKQRLNERLNDMGMPGFRRSSDWEDAAWWANTKAVLRSGKNRTGKVLKGAAGAVAKATGISKVLEARAETRKANAWLEEKARKMQ